MIFMVGAGVGAGPSPPAEVALSFLPPPRDRPPLPPPPLPGGPAAPVDAVFAVAVDSSVAPPGAVVSAALRAIAAAFRAACCCLFESGLLASAASPTAPPPTETVSDPPATVAIAAAAAAAAAIFFSFFNARRFSSFARFNADFEGAALPPPVADAACDALSPSTPPAEAAAARSNSRFSLRFLSLSR